MKVFRIRSFVAPCAFILLSVVLMTVHRIGFFEGAGFSLSVFLGFCLPVLKTKQSRGWIFADLLLAAGATVLLCLDDAVLRVMIMAPILMVSNYFVWWALSFRITSEDSNTLRIPTIGFALSVLFLGPFLLQGPSPLFFIRIPVLLIIPALAIPAGPAVVFFASILCAVASPVFVVLLVALFLLFRLIGKYRGTWAQEDHYSVGISLLGLSVGIASFVMSMAPWGFPPISLAFPGMSWVGWVGFGGIILLSFRFPPASAGALAVLGCLLLGPPMTPIQGGCAAHRLSRTETEVQLKESAEGDYGLDLSMVGGEKMAEGDVAAWLEIGKRRLPLRVGKNLVESSTLSGEGRNAQNLPDDLMIRPPEKAGETWRISVRSRIPFKTGSRVRIVRNPRMPPEAEIIVEAAGPESLSGTWNSERWLWISVALVALLQLFLGFWQRQTSWVPWSFLISGLTINRASVEPLNAAGGRIGIYLAVLAIFCVLIPWFGKWSWKHRS